MPLLKIRFSSKPGDIPTITDLEGYKFGYNSHDAILYGLRSIAGVRTVVPIGGGGGGSSSFVPEIAFEFCVEAGIEEIFTLDIFASVNYIITNAVFESDGSMSGVAVKIDNVDVTGLDNMTIGIVQEFTPTDNNVVPAESKVTLHTTDSFSGSPTIIRGKLILQAL